MLLTRVAFKARQPFVLSVCKPLISLNFLRTIMVSHAKDVGCGTSADTGYADEKLIYPAASRNKEPILQVLQRFMQKNGGNDDVTFLEISSGSGQHIAHFAPNFTHVKFQPSEYDESLLGSIRFYANECTSRNILKPVLIDIRKALSNYGFSENSINYIYNANMIHISPYECTIGLFENAGKYLKPNGLLFTYGPYGKNGIITPESNIRFHESLVSRDPTWGIRDLSALEKLAEANSLKLIEEVDMPANNKTLIWQKK